MLIVLIQLTLLEGLTFSSCRTKPLPNRPIFYEVVLGCGGSVKFVNGCLLTLFGACYDIGLGKLLVVFPHFSLFDENFHGISATFQTSSCNYPLNFGFKIIIIEALPNLIILFLRS